MTKWQVLPLTRFADFRDEWQDLNAAGLNQPILDVEFVEPMMSHFFEGDELFCIGQSDSRITSMGFFRKVNAFHWSTVVPSQAPLSLWLHESGDVSDQEVKSLATALPGLVLMIDYLQLDSEFIVFQGNSFLGQPYIQTGRLKIPENFETWFESLSKNTRQNYRRIYNKAGKEGKILSTEKVTEREAVANAILKYAEIEARSWKASEGTAIAPENAQHSFYHETLSSLALKDAAACWLFKVDDEVVAVDLCIENSKHTVILKTTFDDAYRQYSPAMQLKFAIIDNYAGLGRSNHEIEFYGKAMSWHKKLTDDIRSLEHRTWFSNKLLLSLYKLIKQPATSS